MASAPANTLLSRMRSTRAPANTSKPVQASSRIAPSSATSSAISTATQASSAVSNIPLFLTNLRLLDLDLRQDWPDINPSTFTARDVAQGQKKRIQSVEWALYQLFCLWDSDEARNKLQPFFPPLDQVQSLNLRVALLRSLEQAKKNGVLGRDAVVRKTMLDECKGERLEEVLAVFSSAVLKKLVAEQQLNQPEYPAIAQSWALENRGYTGERTELSVLVLAHRASLSRHLRDKNAARVQFHDFSELLNVKERALARRREQATTLEAQEQETGVLQVTEDVKLDVWRTVRNNWSGNEQWMEALLNGDEHARKDGVLSAPFDRVWRRVRAGGLGELEDQAGGLLQQLDRRVTLQKERLAKWQDFRAKILGKSCSDAVGGDVQPSARQKGVDLGFDAYENLHLGRMSPRKLPHGKPGQLTAEYTDIIDGLQSELDQVGKGSTVPDFLVAPRRKPVDEPGHRAVEEVVSEISELEEELEHSPQPTIPTEPMARILPTEEDEQQVLTPRPRVSPVRMKYEPDWEDRPLSATPTRAPRRPITPGSWSPSRRTAFPIRTSPPKQASPTGHVSPPRQFSPERQTSAERDVSPTQELADQILASMNAASPSPVKKPRHTLSLAERTRLSMARRASKAPTLDEDDEPGLDSLPPSPIRRIAAATGSEDSGYSTHQTADITLLTPTEEPDEHGYEGLVARTRRSMAGFEASRKKAQLERRRSQRQSKQFVPGHRRDGSSYFPSVDEEGNTTLLLAEELMRKEVDDPEAIFKSRPKIKTSPVGSPTREWD